MQWLLEKIHYPQSDISAGVWPRMHPAFGHAHNLAHPQFGMAHCVIAIFSPTLFFCGEGGVNKIASQRVSNALVKEGELCSGGWVRVEERAQKWGLGGAFFLSVTPPTQGIFFVFR